MIILTLFLSLVLSKDACVSGSAECVANTLRVCGIKNQWIYVDCPSGTECSVRNNEIACIPRGSKGESKGRKEADSLSKVGSPEREDPSKAEGPGDDLDDGGGSNDRDDGVDEEQPSGDREENEPDSKKRSKPKDERKNKEDNQRKDKEPNAIEKLKSKLKDISPKKSGSKPSKRKNYEAEEYDPEITRKKRKVKTVTKAIKSSSNTSKEKERETITVIKTIVQKQAPTEIKLEYTSKETIDPKVRPIGTSPSDTTMPPGTSPSSSGQPANAQKPGQPMQTPSPSAAGGAGAGQPSGGALPSGGASPAGGSSGGVSPTPSPGASSGASKPGGSSPGASPSSSPSSGGGAGKPSGGASPAGGSSGGASPTPSPGSPVASKPGGSSPSASPSSSPSSGGGAGKPSGGASPAGGSSGGTSPAPSGGASGGTGSKPSGGSDASKPSGGSTSGSKPSSGGGSGGGGGAVNVTSDQVTQAITKMGFAPKPEYVDAVVSRVNEKFKDLNDAAMFLAQCGHESGGYQYIEEIACSGGKNCSGQYGTGAPGKSYHGRGFIQLSWPDNYKAAGEGLGMGDELYNTPEKVAEDPNIGADVSIWYWESKVANAPGVKDNHFGATTKAINGALECTGSNVDKSKKRYEIYKTLVEILNVNNPADESGCY